MYLKSFQCYVFNWKGGSVTHLWNLYIAMCLNSLFRTDNMEMSMNTWKVNLGTLNYIVLSITTTTPYGDSHTVYGSIIVPPDQFIKCLNHSNFGRNIGNTSYKLIINFYFNAFKYHYFEFFILHNLQLYRHFEDWIGYFWKQAMHKPWKSNGIRTVAKSANFLPPTAWRWNHLAT